MAELIGEAAARTHLPRPAAARSARGRRTSRSCSLTGDRGLAGGFNGYAVRRGRRGGAAPRSARASRCAGSSSAARARGTLRFRGFEVDQAWTGFTDRPHATQDAEAIAHRVIELFAAGEVDRVVMVYNAFRSALVQRDRGRRAAAAGSAELRGEVAARDRDGGPPAVRARGGRDARRPAAARRSRPRSTARCSSRRPPSTAPG